jgi:hypothetical protein
MRKAFFIAGSFLMIMIISLSFSENLHAGNDHHSHKTGKLYILRDTVVVKKDTADTTATPKHRTFTPGLGWASNNTFLGRKDSVDHYLLSPSFAYEGKYGFNASITASHSSTPAPVTRKGKTEKPAKQPTFDEYDIAGGYNHDWNDHFSSSLLETHNFFDSKTLRLKSTIDNDLTLGSSYDTKFITGEVTGDWAHGRKTVYGQSKDYFYTFILSHSFAFENIFHSKWEMDIEPKVDAVYGTQNFYKIYTKGKTIDSTQIKQADYEKKLAAYNWLNTETKLIVTFTNDKWSFAPEWDYEVPMNTPKGAPSLPFSVYTINLTYTFTTKDEKKVKVP